VVKDFYTKSKGKKGDLDRLIVMWKEDPTMMKASLMLQRSVIHSTQTNVRGRWKMKSELAAIFPASLVEDLVREKDKDPKQHRINLHLKDEELRNKYEYRQYYVQDDESLDVDGEEHKAEILGQGEIEASDDLPKIIDEFFSASGSSSGSSVVQPSPKPRLAPKASKTKVVPKAKPTVCEDGAFSLKLAKKWHKEVQGDITAALKYINMEETLTSRGAPTLAKCLQEEKDTLVEFGSKMLECIATEDVQGLAEGVVTAADTSKTKMHELIQSAKRLAA